MTVNRPAAGRLALVVLGSHRSGTSATARVLSLAGAALPAKLMYPQPQNNETGFWEPQEVADFDDRVLAGLDSSWDDLFGPRRADDGLVFDASTVEEAREILRRNYGDASLIVLKEPRMALLADLWKPALREEGFQLAFVIPVRSPLEVAASLKKRDGFTRNRGLLIWTSYMLASERATRGERRVFLSFDSLLGDPEAELDRIERKLGVRFPQRTWESAGRIEEFLRGELKSSVKAPLSALSGPLSPVLKLYEHLQAAAEDAPENEDVTAEVQEWFRRLEEVVAPVVKQVGREAQRKAASAGEALRAEIDDERGRAEALTQQLEATRLRAESLTAELDHERDRTTTLAAELGTTQARAAELDGLLAGEREQSAAGTVARTDAERRLASLGAELAALRAHAAEDGKRLASALQGAQEAERRVRAALEESDARHAAADERAKAAEARAQAAQALGEQLEAAQAAERRLRLALEEAQARAQMGEALREELAAAGEARAQLEAELADARRRRDEVDELARGLERSARTAQGALEQAQREAEELRRTAETAGRERDEARRAAEARTTVVENALAVARRRSAETGGVLQQRIAAAQVETREAREALAAALVESDARLVEAEATHRTMQAHFAEQRRELEARLAAESRSSDQRREELEGRLAQQHAEGRRFAEQRRELEARIVEETRGAASRLHEERTRYAAEDAELRERLASTGVAAAAAQARVRELQAQLDAARDELERRAGLGWVGRLFGRR